jgi:hypothetical protein
MILASSRDRKALACFLASKQSKKENDMRKYILTAIGVLVIAIIITSMVIMNNKIDSLQTKTTKEQAEITSLQQQQKQSGSEFTTIENTLGSLNRTVMGLSDPVDPLSAYTDICNVQLDNGATGIQQTYYYPCTNNAETIPQPGN